MSFSSLRLIAVVALSIMLLSACTRHIYGVPQDDWRRMNDSDRSEVIRLHQERRLHEERRRAAEAEVRAMEMEERRRAYPDVVYLRLAGGFFYFKGQPYHYHQHAFQLRKEQTRVLTLISVEGQPPQRIRVVVRYHDGKILLGDGKRFTRSFDYRDEWHQGDHYKGIKLRGGVRVEGLELSIGPKPFAVKRHRAEKQQKARVKKARHEKARQEKARQEKAKQQKAKQQKAKQQKAKQQKAKQQKAKQQKVKQQKAKQEKAKQQKAKQQKAKQQKARQEKAKQQKAKQQKAKQEKAKQEKAKPENGKQESEVEEPTATTDTDVVDCPEGRATKGIMGRKGMLCE